MIQDIGAGRFDNQYHPTAPEADSVILSFRKNEVFLFVTPENTLRFLSYGELLEKEPEKTEALTYLFAIDKKAYFLADDLTQELYPEFSYLSTRALRGAMPKENGFAAITGYQLYDWYRTRKYCPCCGKPMVHDEKERMMRCDACGNHEYPKIMPAVIVAVTNGDKLLMSKYAGRAYTNYALIAGFNEIGETLEETVHREVLEETGLRVKNLRYYKSQPWAFTGTLLMGFFCELDGDDTITIDKDELALAGFYDRSEIPEDPGVALTTEMMNCFKYGKL